MTTDEQFSDVLERIATDHGSRSEVNDLIIARRRRRAARRRRLAIGSSAVAVAAAIAAVFAIAGNLTGTSAPHPVPAATPMASPSPASTETPSEPPAAQSSSLSSAQANALESAQATVLAQEKALESRADAAASAMRAGQNRCQDDWRAHPVFVDGTADPTAITALAKRCAASFGATSTPTITWVLADQSAVAAIFNPDQNGAADTTPVAIALITARFPAPIADDTQDSTAALIIPAAPNGQLGVNFPVDPQTAASITKLGRTHRG